MKRTSRHQPAAAARAQARRRRAGFTLIEMMVVIGIIGLVAAMTVPLMVPFMRARKLDRAAEVVKVACARARSIAIRERRRIAVTLLEAEKMVIITDYEQLKNMLPVQEIGVCADNSDDTRLVRASETANRSGYYVTLVEPDSPGFGQQRWIMAANGATLFLNSQDPWLARGSWTCPDDNSPPDDPSDQYVIGGRDYDDVCPHYFNEADPPAGNYLTVAERERVLTTMAIEPPRILPEGCRFDLDDDGSDPTAPELHGWTYIFLPTGGAITLTTAAENDRDYWSQTTLMDSNDKPTGPRVYAPRDRDSAIIVVYAMTGQVRDEK